MQTQTPEPVSIHQSMITWDFLIRSYPFSLFVYLDKSYLIKMRMVI
jgi:hypothetical protein